MGVASTIRDQLEALFGSLNEGPSSLRYNGSKIIPLDISAAFPPGTVGAVVKQQGAEIDAIESTVSAHGSMIAGVKADVSALGAAVETIDLTGSAPFADVETGRLATPELGKFTVGEVGDRYVTRYQVVDGVAVYDNAIPGISVTDALQDATREGTGQQDVTTDPFGFVIAGGDEKGSALPSDDLSTPAIDVGFAVAPGVTLQTDRFGFIFEDSSADPVAGQPSSAADVADREVANLAYAAKLRARPLPMIQPIMDDWVGIVLWFGQSLSRAAEGYPPLTVEVPSYSDDNVLTVGMSDRPWTQGNSPEQITFDPLGDDDLHNLIAISNINNTVLDAAAMAALAADSNVPGESMSIASTYYLRQQWLASKGLDEAPEAPWLVISAGVGGKSIGELSKGASPNWYNRILDAFAKIKAHPDPRIAGKKFYVIAVNISQGEKDNELGLAGPNNTATLYQQTWEQLRADLNADIFANFPDQKFPPAYFLMQTGGSFILDETNLHVTTAQTNIVRTVPGVFAGPPQYPFPNKPSGHLEPNGYRWAGCLLGREQAEVLVHRRNTFPLTPRKISYVRARHELLIDWIVPEDGLVFGMPYKGFLAATMPNWGLIARDGAGDIFLAAPRILGQTIVACTPDRPFGDDAWLDVGSRQAHGGYINIKSPSASIAAETYKLVADSGQYAAANIPALVNKPYPMDYWAWGGTFPVEIV